MTGKPCCMDGVLHTGEAKGKYIDFHGTKSYITGEGQSRVIVIITDIYGCEFINTQLVADTIAKAGYTVLIPDIFDGTAADFETVSKDQKTLMQWIADHPAEVIWPRVEKAVDDVISELKPSFIGAVGHCFGGRYVARLLAGDKINAGAAAHPSLVTEEEFAAVKKPLMINAAESDSIFPDEARLKAKQILEGNKVRYYISVASGVKHGFSVRADISDPVQKWAKEKATCDQIEWFNLFSGECK